MPATRRRTTTKLLRLYPEELADITARAEICGLKPARFIRQAALGPMPKARHHVETDRLLRALARLGRQLEQAMRHVRSSGEAELAELIASAVDGHRALVAQVVAQSAARSRRSSAPPARRREHGADAHAGAPPASGRAEPFRDQLTIDFPRAALHGLMTRERTTEVRIWKER